MYKIKPEIITDKNIIANFANKGKEIIDCYEEQLLELFLIRNPEYRFNKNFESEFSSFKSSAPEGLWFSFPWTGKIIKLLPETEFFELHSARNKNLITIDEQKKYYNSTVAVAGLSVGSHAALTIAMTGGAKNIKLADFDKISLSNLNRLRYGSSSLNKNKAQAAGEIIAEINPYSNIYIYDDGITKENISSFVSGDDTVPKSNIIIEGVDNLEMKILLREEARSHNLPLIMATDNGDGIIVDIERYDLDKNLKLFNGALGDFSIETFKNFPPQDLPKLATKVAGPEYIVPRMLSSLMQVGKTLYSWPQLGTAATFTGVASAYLVRSILMGKNIKSGKYNLSLEKIFDADLGNSEGINKQNEERNNLLKRMGI